MPTTGYEDALNEEAMNGYNEIDTARGAQIDRRLGQSFALARDVIDDPSILDDIPDGSRLTFRDIALRQLQVR
jgi:hypothetical protein